MYMFTGLWVAGKSHPPLLPNSCAAVGGSGDRPLMWLEVGAPEGCQGNHGCGSPQPFASLPWRQ